jgi:hypothetical protein
MALAIITTGSRGFMVQKSFPTKKKKRSSPIAKTFNGNKEYQGGHVESRQVWHGLNRKIDECSETGEKSEARAALIQFNDIVVKKLKASYCPDGSDNYFFLYVR